MVSVDTAVQRVIKKMKLEIKGLIVAYLLYGKNIGNISKSELKRLGKSYDADDIATAINSAFISGLGIWDAIVGYDDNYGKQLDVCIKDVLCKAFDKAKPMFGYDYDSWDGVLERERWIVHAFLERFWDNLSDKDKLKLLKGMEKELKKAGIAYEKLMKKIMAGHASITVIRSMLGFKFHIFLAKIANLIARAIAGRGLSLAANAALQRISAIIFGPIGWIVTALSAITIVTDLLNPREWDKYIPAVFLIALHREI